MVCGAGWGAVGSQLLQLNPPLVPGAFLIHLEFLEKLNHHPHLKNERGAFYGREKEDVRFNQF